MSQNKSDDYDVLKQRIQDLEQEVSDREKDLALFRETLNVANEKFEKLISQIHKSVEVSRQIQKKLVPTELPHIPDFEFSMKFIPSSSQGGDYYDIFEQKNRLCFGMVMAESSGYNISALLMSRLLQFSEAIRSKEHSHPCHIGKLLIEEMTPRIENHEQTHFFYAKVDRRNFEVNYIKMGNILGLLQKSDNKELVLFEKTSGPIQSDFKGDLSEKKVFLDAKDRLLFCTQGVIQTKNEKGEFFGQERLFRSFLEAPKSGVHELRNKILFDLSQFSSNKPVCKDLTILSCEVKERVIKLA